MEGNADKAEPLLKRAAAAGSEDPRVNQNLALVLGLQGKYDEAKLVAARDLPAEKAAANVDYVRSIVMLEPRPMAPAKGGATSPSRRQLLASRARPPMTARRAGPHRRARPSGNRRTRALTRRRSVRIVGMRSTIVATSHMAIDTGVLVCKPLMRS